MDLDIRVLVLVLNAKVAVTMSCAVLIVMELEYIRIKVSATNVVGAALYRFKRAVEDAKGRAHGKLNVHSATDGNTFANGVQIAKATK